MVRLTREVAPVDGSPPLPDPPDDRRRARYAPQKPFPPYRYVPGSGLPHPINDPAGHSHRVGKEVPHEPWTPHLWMLNEDWLWGIDLYNHWYFWEAHEAWESLWQVTDKSRPAGLFLQALIQVSAAMLKVHLRSATGARALWAGAEQRLLAVEEHHRDLMGLRVSAVRKSVGGFLQPLSRGEWPLLAGEFPLILPER